MPLYEYECTKCGHLTELLQRHGDPPLESCPQCGGTVRKLFSAPAVQFKGTGWYVTDYGGKGKAPAASAEKSSGGDKEAKKSSDESSSGGKKTDSKSSGSKE
jgi:putative FmdB family regulatory protein